MEKASFVHFHCSFAQLDRFPRWAVTTLSVSPYSSSFDPLGFTALTLLDSYLSTASAIRVHVRCSRQQYGGKGGSSSHKFSTAAASYHTPWYSTNSLPTSLLLRCAMSARSLDG